MCHHRSRFTLYFCFCPIFMQIAQPFIAFCMFEVWGAASVLVH